MTAASVLSNEWIFGDVEANPIGKFDDFDYLFAPETVASMPKMSRPTTTECTTPTCGCSAGPECTTACGPLTTTDGFCGC
jgi:hypothetical protein